MNLVTIQNKAIRVTLDPKGAVLHSIIPSRENP